MDKINYATPQWALLISIFILAPVSSVNKARLCEAVMGCDIISAERG